VGANRSEGLDWRCSLIAGILLGAILIAENADPVTALEKLSHTICK